MSCTNKPFSTMPSILQKIKDWLNPSVSLKNVSSPAPVQINKPITVHAVVTSPTPDDTLLLRKVKLIMVTAENNNKVYEMEENPDGTFTAIYGRVGSKSSKVSYPIAEWNTKYKEKLAKGYTDQTHLFADSAPETDTSTIEDVNTRNLIEKLMQYATNSIKHNYVVSANQVTRKQVEEAQQLIDNLAKAMRSGLNLDEFNQTLLALYKIIPRKMGKVNEHLITANDTSQRINDKLGDEQETLDVMRTQVEIFEQQKGQSPTEELGFLESIGLSISPVEDPRIVKLIKLMMGDSVHKYHSAYGISNLKTQKLFENWLPTTSNKKTQLFWHGSRNENWLSIIKTGLALRPANAVITGKMFGNGIYFANEFKKSINYTSISGSVWAGGKEKDAYLAIYEVHTGNQLEISQHDNSCLNLDLKALQKRGKYDSVYAKRGVSLLNNEYIVYRENQCTIKYLVKIKP